MQIECKKIKLRKWTVSICGVTDAKGFAELCCADSKEDKPNFEAIKCSKSTRVYRFEWAGKMWFFKEFRYRNPLKQLRVLNRGNHLYRMAHALNRNGFETPDIVCHARKGMRTFVVSEEANADDSVYNYLMEKSEITLSDLQRFRFLFGQEIGRLHGAGFVHGDLRWGAMHKWLSLFLSISTTTAHANTGRFLSGNALKIWCRSNIRAVCWINQSRIGMQCGKDTLQAIPTSGSRQRFGA